MRRLGNGRLRLAALGALVAGLAVGATGYVASAGEAATTASQAATGVLNINAPLRQECDPFCPISLVSFTSVVSRNDYATLKVNVRPRARCRITVGYLTGPSSTAFEVLLGKVLLLGDLRPKIGGLITWRWKVGSNTKLGRWPIVVDCGPLATLTLRVVR